MANIIVVKFKEIVRETNLDGDVDGVNHHSAMGRSSLSGSTCRVVHLQDSDDGQLVEGRGAGVQHNPRACSGQVSISGNKSAFNLS